MSDVKPFTVTVYDSIGNGHELEVVHHSDYAALETENARLKQQIDWEEDTVRAAGINSLEQQLHEAQENERAYDAAFAAAWAVFGLDPNRDENALAEEIRKVKQQREPEDDK